MERFSDISIIVSIYRVLFKLNLSDEPVKALSHCAYCAKPISLGDKFCSARCQHQHYE